LLIRLIIFLILTWRAFDRYLNEKTRTKLNRHIRQRKRLLAEQRATTNLNSSATSTDLKSPSVTSTSSLVVHPNNQNSPPIDLNSIDISDTINKIPQYFLSSQFSLNNIDTLTSVILGASEDSSRAISLNAMSEVSQQSDLSDPNSSHGHSSRSEQRIDYRAAQEHLSHYLDNVENAIAKLLKDKAGGLFESISKTERMQKTMQDASENFKQLRYTN